MHRNNPTSDITKLKLLPWPSSTKSYTNLAASYYLKASDGRSFTFFSPVSSLIVYFPPFGRGEQESSLTHKLFSTFFMTVSLARYGVRKLCTLYTDRDFLLSNFQQQFQRTLARSERGNPQTCRRLHEAQRLEC